MTSKMARSKGLPAKQDRTRTCTYALRPRRTKSDTENPQLNEIQSKKTRKRKIEFEDTVDTVDGARFGRFGKMSRLFDAHSSWAQKTEGLESIDGGPLDFYPMRKKGRLYIIHNCVFNELPFREGSGHDVGKLTTCFQELGFIHDPTNDCKSNITCEEMRSSCEFWATRNHSDVDCIILAILTHGTHPNLLQGYYGKYIAVDELLAPFRRGNNATLVGKPKIFFIQACRGENINIGVRDHTATSDTNNIQQNVTSGVFPSSFQTNEAVGSFTNSGLLPPQADHLIAFATGVGNPAYRNREEGSFYIEELTKTLREDYSRKHLTDIITKVQGRVSNLVRGRSGLERIQVQMPEFISRLRGPIYLS